MLQIFFAFIAGILTIAAPCILLPLPIILGGSVGQKNKTRPLFLALGFIFSFTALALIINFLVSSLGLNPNYLRLGAVILLTLFSLFMIWPRPFEKLMTRFNGIIGAANKAGESLGRGNLSGFVLGAIIGIIWAPCAGPILASILTLVALQSDLGQAGVLLTAYAIGAGLPMLAIAYGGQALTTGIKKVARYSARIQQIFGLILILLAAAIYFQYDTVIQAKLLAYFPSSGLNIEQNFIDNFKKSSPSPINKSTASAPEFAGIAAWLNSEPLTMDGLRGQVVLIDFWTYSCINCVRTLPYVTQWYDAYKNKGFVVIGVHSPEFAFEKDTENVKKAIAQYNINYPVAQDNDLKTWRAYNNQYWPAEYLIDQQGNIVYTHFGEGKYDVTENAIRRLLGLKADADPDNGQNLSGIRSPEMYFGYNREEYLSEAQRPSTVDYEYSLPAKLNLNNFALDGTWKFFGDRATLDDNNGKIKLRFSSAKLFMVAQSLEKPQTLEIYVDGKKQPDVVISGSALYTLFNSEDYSEHTIEINIPQAGFDAFTFTFG